MQFFKYVHHNVLFAYTYIAVIGILCVAMVVYIYTHARILAIFIYVGNTNLIRNFASFTNNMLNLSALITYGLRYIRFYENCNMYCMYIFINILIILLRHTQLINQLIFHLSTSQHAIRLIRAISCR